MCKEARTQPSFSDKNDFQYSTLLSVATNADWTEACSAFRIEIIGPESLGVRSLCSLVTTRDRCILVDPGLSLGYVRHGLFPHPLQVVIGRTTRMRILHALNSATDVVISHFHGDHSPLAHV